MPKKPKTSQTDLDHFHAAVKDVKPLKKDKVRLSPPVPKRRPIQPEIEEELPSLIDHSSLRSEIATPVSGEEFISYKQIGVANKTLRNLRKGQYNVEAILDLHGMTIDEAENALENFLHDCLKTRVQVGLIIHGKGNPSQMPILKNKLNLWLRAMNIVLAFCTAIPRHGGGGALYVFLKRI